MEDLGEATPRRMLSPLNAAARWLWKGASDIIFPPSCPGCGCRLAQHGALCHECWQRISFIERPYCEVLGTPFAHDLGSGILSAEAIASPPVFNRLRAACLFDGTARNLVHALKYRDHTELAPMMGRWMARAGGEILGNADLIIPVPLHRWRLMSRRFNQAAELARIVAHVSDRQFDGASLYRKRHTVQQIGLGKPQRETNMRGAFDVTETAKVLLFGKRVVLIDDVYTTGATVSAATRALKRAGAADVSVLTFAIAIASPPPRII